MRERQGTLTSSAERHREEDRLTRGIEGGRGKRQGTLIPAPGDRGARVEWHVVMGGWLTRAGLPFRLVSWAGLGWSEEVADA